MDKKQKKILDSNRFERCGTVAEMLKSDEWDGVRVIYAITDPQDSRVVYIGDTETGRNLRARLKAHMAHRAKAGLVEEDSRVYVHFMVTEYKVLTDFEEATGALPELNKRKVQK
ncbi:MAG: hypothetical protein ABIO70_14530 [Pseudomonadota bacterium]